MVGDVPCIGHLPKLFPFLACPCATKFLFGEHNTPPVVRRWEGGIPHNLQAGTVSLSNAGLIIKWQTGWYGSTQNCHQSLSVNTHSSRATKGKKEVSRRYRGRYQAYFIQVVNLRKRVGFDIAHRIVETDKKEVEFYQRYKDYYSYGFYIAQKI